MDIATMNKDGLMILLNKTRNDLEYYMQYSEQLQDNNKELETMYKQLAKELNSLEKVIDRFKSNVDVRDILINDLLKEIESMRHRSNAFTPKLEKTIIKMEQVVKARQLIVPEIDEPTIEELPKIIEKPKPKGFSLKRLLDIRG